MSDRRWRCGTALMCLAACGCAVMRDLPRGDYARVPERHDVRIVTRGGEGYTFDRVQLAADTLTGYVRKNVEGSFDEFATVRLGLDDVARMSVRSVDWYRTGVLGGVALAAVLAVVLTQANGSSGDGSPGPPRPPPSGPASRR